MKIAPPLILSILLAGCNVQAKHDNDNDSDENVTISGGEGGNLSFDLPFAKGQIKLPDGAFKGGDFDIDGVKMYPGGTVTGFNVVAADRGSTVNIAFKAPAPPEKVRAYFVEEFKKKGVTASAAGDAVSGKSKDGDTFKIRVQPVGGGSQGTVDIQSDD
ncbi:MAG: hypothetical protein V4513_08885 [Pseudomonadota bacterium]